MWSGLEDELLSVCNRKILAAERRRGRQTDENRRRQRRSLGSVDLVNTDPPELWKIPGFDPYEVRRNRESIAYAIRSKLRNRTYQPYPPQLIAIPKPDGRQRTVSAFPIADEVISLRLFKALLRKNRSRLSARSFAYRSDIGAQDAIRHLRREWKGTARLFVAEYDLTDYFDTISHAYIQHAMAELGFSMTDLENYLINAFIMSPLPSSSSSTLPIRRSLGVPQGTSISLLLANVATGVLDRKLETMNLDFVRYADDLLMWSEDYRSISDGVGEFWSWAENARLKISHAKSKGIRLVVPPEVSSGEITSTHSVTFLSHDIGLNSVAVSEKAIQGVKARVRRLLYDNLLREAVRGSQNTIRLTGNDRDYATYIWQLRRYIYGSHSEKELRRIEHGTVPNIFFTGVMAHFPYTTADAVVRELDEWITTETWLALRRRELLLTKWVATPPAPWGLSREALKRFQSKSTKTGRVVDLRLPSTERMIRVIRKAVEVHGVSAVDRLTHLY